MAYDYAKLNGRIIEICGTKSKFAKLMGLSERTVSLKLNNKIMFKQDEIMKASNILKISIDEIQKYFFVLKVWLNWTLIHSWTERGWKYGRTRAPSFIYCDYGLCDRYDKKDTNKYHKFRRIGITNRDYNKVVWYGILDCGKERSTE